MILEYYGVKKSEKELRILFKTTPTFGTLWELVEREIKNLNFEFHWRKFWTLAEVSSLVEKSIPVIIGIKRKDEIHGHALTVVGVSEKFVTAADPETANLISIPMSEFPGLWLGRDNIAGYLEKRKLIL